MFFKKIFISFIILSVFLNLLFSNEGPELRFKFIKVKKGNTFWSLFKDKWRIAAQINKVNPESLKVGTLLAVPSNWGLAQQRFNHQLIVVEIEKRILKFFEKGELKMEFPVRVGKEKNPTPVGIGVIYKKRERPVFRYTEGPQKGELIRYSYLKNGRTIRIPIKDMRALGIFINNTDKYSIHSTTEEDTIGRAVSSGCIGMRIKDMLLLYPFIKEGAKVIIKP